MRTRAIVLLFLLLLLPLAAGHTGGPDDLPPADPTPREDPSTLDPWIGSWDGVPWYGTIGEIASAHAPIHHLRASGDFLVWESEGDIRALNVPSGATFDVTRDALVQANPVIDGRRVVYEQRGGLTMDLWEYDLDSGTARRLTTSPGNEKSPYVRGKWLAWLDDRNGRWDVYGMDLETRVEFPVSISTPKKSDVLVFGDGIVGWREVEHNQWDVFVRQLPNGEVRRITRDRTLEHPPATDGAMLYWVKLADVSGASSFTTGVATSENILHRWDPETGEIRSLGRKGVTTNPLAFLPGGVEITYVSSGPGKITVISMNRSADRFSILATAFPASAPAVAGNTLFFAVRNETHHAIVAARPSPFATSPPPTLKIARPLDGGVLYTKTFANGTYKHSSAWPEPVRIEYRLGQAGTRPMEWKPFTASTEWSTTVDPAGYAEDRPVRLHVRAVYDNAPPIEESVTLAVRDFSGSRLELPRGEAVTLALFVEKNPGIVLLGVLGVLLVALLLARYLLRRRPKTVRRVEYVRPED